MATKRKYDVALSWDNADTPVEAGGKSTSPQDSQGTAVENYPRKRIAIACNVCRFRKTRCDAVKPSCGFCTDLGIECTYRKPTAGDRAKPPSAPPEALADIERRLSQVEARLDSAQQIIQNATILPPLASNTAETVPTSQDLISRTSGTNRTPRDHRPGSSGNITVGTPASSNVPFRQTATEAFNPRPSLITFWAPPYLRHVEGWDYSAEFYDDEIFAGEQLCEQLEYLLEQPIDLSKRTTRRLQQSFVENFLRWTPLFEANYCVNAMEQAAAVDFLRQDAATCLTFMSLALGAISENRRDNVEDLEPGLDYFARGCQILERLSLRTGSLTTLQCRVLQASYLKFTIRPLQAWNSITQAARDCMHMLSSNKPQRMTSAEQEALHRTFWACSIILHELEATMKMHPIGLRHFHELVRLPQFEEEDSGFYYFLAQISLRNFLTRSMQELGYHSGQVIYAPVIIKELRKQIREWYDHLPSVVRFPKDATPVFDSRKSFLRGQYIALFVVLGWPSVLKMMEHVDGGSVLLDPETLAITRDQAEGCIKSCCLFVQVADEQLMGRRMGTHFTLWATYASLATLLVTFHCPALDFVPETKEEHHIRSGYEVLRPWSHLPLIARGLQRAQILMQQVGIVRTEGVIEGADAPISSSEFAMTEG